MTLQCSLYFEEHPEKKTTTVFSLVHSVTCISTPFNIFIKLNLKEHFPPFKIQFDFETNFRSSSPSKHIMLNSSLFPQDEMRVLEAETERQKAELAKARMDEEIRQIDRQHHSALLIQRSYKGYR